jgi:threonine aldolase
MKRSELRFVLEYCCSLCTYNENGDFMSTYNFQNDYSEGAHPRILEALCKTNLFQAEGYGEDPYCLEAADLIRRTLQNPRADVHFVSGGTQANLILLSSFLRPFESVIAVDSAHICVHETGAIESTGHKIHPVKGQDGKVTIPEIQAVVAEHYFEHMVKPRAVYISQSTEVGTIYSASELGALSQACKELNLILYLDGARLGSALTSKSADICLPELSALVDAFYIGGTKNGALIGEAVVINNPQLKSDFRYMIKQKGAMLAKGRLLGIQFLELFKDNLYFDLARHANQMAERLTAGVTNLGYSFETQSTTNQIFPILPDEIIEALSKNYSFYVWNHVDRDHSSIRLVTSWATPETAVDHFLTDLEKIGKDINP